MLTLFDPVTIGDLTIPNRIIMSSPTWLALEATNSPNDLIAQYYRAGERVVVRGEVTGTPAGTCSGCLIPARAFVSRQSTFKRSEMARSLEPTTWKVG